MPSVTQNNTPLQNNIIGESKRLIYRKITPDDFGEIREMMNSPHVKEIWEQDFSPKDIKIWIDKCQKSYSTKGMGYFIIIEKTSGSVAGQVSLSEDTIEGKIYCEIGYILKQTHTKKGYATESAKYMADIAFKNLNLKEVIFEIRPQNISSIKVAKRLGAKTTGRFIKKVGKKEMEHLIFTLKNPGQK